MKITILGLLIFSGLLFFYYPQINEDVAGNCVALEKQMLRSYLKERKEKNDWAENLALRGMQGLSNGTVASIAVKDQYPELPASVSCVLVYWGMLERVSKALPEK